MSVKAILDEKGRQVVTVGLRDEVRQAAALLYENRIGAVIIVEAENRIAGILTERDIVTAIARYGADCLDKSVADVMVTKVHTCTEEMSIEDIMEIMNDRRTRHLPVERNGKLVGIVSIGDAVRNHIRMIENEAEHIKAYIAG